MKSFKILSRHPTLAAAVAAAGIDLSYNEPEARREIATTDKQVLEAFIVEKYGEPIVLYVYDCDIRLLNTFTPFSSCLSGSDFGVAALSTDGTEIVATEASVRYSRNCIYRVQSTQCISKIGAIWATKDFC